MKSCVLAYSGGLDTSVILGWLMDEGYEVHAVYVDLGQPGEDRQEVLKSCAATTRFRFCHGKPNTKVRICWERRSRDR